MTTASPPEAPPDTTETDAPESATLLTTEEFACLNLVQPQTVRSRLCLFKSYYGVIPVRLANGRLAWPKVQIRA